MYQTILHENHVALYYENYEENHAKRNMRIETRIGSSSFVLFLVFRQIMNALDQNNVMIHLCLGTLIGLAFVNILIGMLPEPAYGRIKKFKSALVSWIPR